MQLRSIIYSLIPGTQKRKTVRKGELEEAMITDIHMSRAPSLLGAFGPREPIFPQAFIATEDEEVYKVRLPANHRYTTGDTIHFRQKQLMIEWYRNGKKAWEEQVQEKAAIVESKYFIHK